MAKFSKMQVMAAMKETGMVPVFFNKDIEICKNVIKACYEGGVRVFEFTNRGDFAHEIFGELVKWSDKECPEMILGAGTVVDAGTASFEYHPSNILTFHFLIVKLVLKLFYYFFVSFHGSLFHVSTLILKL